MKRQNADRLKLYFTEESDRLSLVRTNWFSDFLIKYLRFDKHKTATAKILDVGCGNGKLLYNLQSAGISNIHGCDYSIVSKNMSKLMKSYLTIDLNKESLIDAYGRESFDLVCCCEVLEHLFDPEKTLIEMLALIKRKGYLFITIPLDLNILARTKFLFGQNIHDPFAVGSHIKYFKPKNILHKLAQYNVEIVKVKYLGLGYGTLDQKLPYISTNLARMVPSLFSSDMMILVKKK